MPEAQIHKSKLSTLKNLLFLTPVFFVWIEIALPIVVGPLFGENNRLAFIYSVIGYGIYLAYTYLLITTIQKTKSTFSKNFQYTAYLLASIILIAGLHAGIMIVLGLLG